MRYNVKDSKFILRNSQLERYFIDIVKRGTNPESEFEANRLKRIVGKLPKRYGKVLKHPENYAHLITMDDKHLILSLFDAPYVGMALKTDTMPEIGEASGKEFRFAPTLNRLLKTAKEDDSKWSESFIYSNERALRYFTLVGNVQNSSLYLANHDWKKVKKTNHQDKLDEGYQKIKHFINSLISFGIDKKALKEIAGLSLWEAKILMHISVNDNMTLTQSDISQHFLSRDYSQYIKQAMNVLCSKGYITPQLLTVKKKSKASYSVTGSGWRAMTSIMDMTFNY